VSWISLCVCSLLTSVCVASCIIVAAQPAALANKNQSRIDRRYAVARGDWSAATVSLFNTWSALDDNPGRHMTIPSPDHKKLVEIIGNHMEMRVNGRIFDTDIDNITKHDAELGWAPDSSKYFVTWSESGELGPWHMQVYEVDDSGIHEFLKVEEPARLDFERRVRARPIDPELNDPDGRHFWDIAQYCEPYHVIGGRWLNGSKEVLLSVLIRNTGDCRYGSDFNVYRIDPTTGRVLQRYTAVEAHKLFGGRYLPRIIR
jgi:hypothetical protein